MLVNYAEGVVLPALASFQMEYCFKHDALRERTIS